MKALLLVVSLALACAPVATAPQSQPVVTSPSTGIHFSAERVSPGTIRLQLDNGAPHAIGYNLCTSELQLRSASGWNAVPTDEVCTMQLLSLKPGADATFEKRLPAGLVSGEYRYVARIESPVGSEAILLATAAFKH